MDTQGKAFEAVRKGLADTLDDLNPTYKALSQDFYNILDKYYDIAGKTGFQGQTAAGVSKALEGAGLSNTLGKLGSKVGEVLGETEIVKLRALEAILKDILK